MAENSKIEWTDHTFNPWRGCTKVSDGCKFCYAETMSKRSPVLGVWGPKGTRVVASEAQWKLPIKWNRQAEAEGVRKKVFCASLADVFEMGDTMPADMLDRVSEARARLCKLIEETPHLDWLLLTKRPENWQLCVPTAWQEGFPPNVWLGTSVENQAAADERIPHLMRCPAAVRFLSCEPLLGDVKLGLPHSPSVLRKSGEQGFIRGFAEAVESIRIHWVICGGESGPNARPMHPDWARSLRDQCQAAGVAFFFKQWGEWAPGDAWDGWSVGAKYDEARWCGDDWSYLLAVPASMDQHCDDAADVYRIGKARAGRLLDGREWKEYPEAQS